MLLANVRQFTDMEVVLLFAEQIFTVPIHFREAGYSVFVYENPHMDYVAAVRPYLLSKYLKENPAAERETYFYIDSDIIFRQWPQLPGENSGMVIGSDCGHYIDLAYIEQCKRGPEIAAQMAEICGTTREQMIGVPGIGAHIILTNPTAEFWARAYQDSLSIYAYLEGLGETTNIQKWTAEMWAQLFGWRREGKTLMISKQLDFCLPTDPIERYDEVNILHNAGVLVTQSDQLFFKGQYIDKSPIGRNFDWVRRDKASYRYVEALEKVVT